MTTDVAADGSAPIQQSPTERARDVLEPAEQLRSNTYRPLIPLFSKALNGEEIVQALEARMYALEASQQFVAVHWSLLREARDEIERLRPDTSQAAQPVEADGVERVAEALFSRVDDRKWNDPRIDMLTKDEWRDLAKAAIAATPPAPATDAGEVGPCFLCARKCRGHSLVDQSTWEPEEGSQAQRIRDGVASALATPPAPNDDLRAALEAAIDRMGWPEIHAFQDELRKGQNVREDAGGFMLRALKALFGIKPTDPVTTYQQAARALVDAALKENRRG